MKKNRTKRIIIIIFSIIILSTYFIGNYFVNYTLLTSDKKTKRNVKNFDNRYEEIIEKNKKIEQENALIWKNSFKDNEVKILSNDEIRLVGHEFKQNNDSKNWIIVVHGYKSSENRSFIIAKRLFEKGYNVLTIAMRAHKPSEGKYIGMAYLDKDDLQLWTKFLTNKYENSKIVYHGTSMGAATTIMAAGINKYDNLVGIIDDCGYSNLWEIFSLELNKRFNLPAFPILHMSDIVARIKAGYSISSVDVLAYTKNITVPTLIIHGTADNFVPLEMSEKIYNAIKHDNKKFVKYEGATHADSKYLYIEEYYNEVFEFLEKAFNK